MSIFCFSSLKGGVGKTSLSVNVAHAFARRGCRTLIVDLDPSAHASRLFLAHHKVRGSGATGGWSIAAAQFVGADARRNSSSQPNRAPLAHLLMTRATPEELATEQLPEQLLSDETCELSALDSNSTADSSGPNDSAVNVSAMDSNTEQASQFVVSVRENLDLLPGSGELRHFLWGRGAKAFATMFGGFLSEMRGHYDYIIIDTPPDFNVLTRNAIAHADLVVVPVDSSEMSINSLEELYFAARHLKGPVWSIARTMVNRGSTRVQQFSTHSLESRLPLERCNLDDAGHVAADLTDAKSFMSLLRNRQSKAVDAEDCRRLFLLHAFIPRTDHHNRLSFLGKTAFDTGATADLSEHYLSAARELEDIISYVEEDEVELSPSPFFGEHLAPRVSC